MEFPDPHVHLPQSPHTHTAILLHGRASNGPEFAEELFSSKTSKSQSLPDCLPSWRWVFPTSRDRWSARFQEDMCSWFDAYSLDNIHERQELQIDGLRESVLHILNILENEIELLNEKASHVYLGGISQGMATALWTLLNATGRKEILGPLGGFLGFCGWLPFAKQVENLIRQRTPHGSPGPDMQRLVCEFFINTTASDKFPRLNQSVNIHILSTPIFLSHGTDDIWVSAELGRQAFRILQRILTHVEWYEFTGAEEEGHWIKEPEGFDQILRFLEDRSARISIER
jgi:lysophospholipase-2